METIQYKGKEYTATNGNCAEGQFDFILCLKEVVKENDLNAGEFYMNVSSGQVVIIDSRGGFTFLHSGGRYDLREEQALKDPEVWSLIPNPY